MPVFDLTSLFPRIARPSGSVPGILIVDDHPAIRSCVRMLLDAHSLQVCGEAPDGKIAIEKAWELRPDVVLLDISMPIMNGFAVAQELRRTLPSTKIVFLTLHESNYFVEKTKLWSHGFVLKSKAATQLVPILKQLLVEPLAQPQSDDGLRYPWQEVVRDAFAATRESLPSKINIAERTIAALLVHRDEIDRAERLALKKALRALKRLISETKFSEEAGDKKKGVA